MTEHAEWVPEFLERLRDVDDDTVEAVDDLLEAVKQARRSKPSPRPVIHVLDTNAVSALMKASAAFVERLASHAPGDIAIPQPVLAEITFGIVRVPGRLSTQRRFPGPYVIGTLKTSFE